MISRWLESIRYSVKNLNKDAPYLGVLDAVLQKERNMAELKGISDYKWPVNAKLPRDLPDTLDEAHERIVRLEDAVQREVETVWSIRDKLHDKYDEEFVAKGRHRAMVNRLLKEIPREWIRKFIYFNDPHYTTVRRDTLNDLYRDDYDSWDGEY